MMDDMTIANAKWRGRRSRTSLEHRPEYTMQRNDQLLARADGAMGRLRFKTDLPKEPPGMRNICGAGFVLRAAS